MDMWQNKGSYFSSNMKRKKRSEYIYILFYFLSTKINKLRGQYATYSILIFYVVLKQAISHSQSGGYTEYHTLYGVELYNNYFQSTNLIIILIEYHTDI